MGRTPSVPVRPLLVQHAVAAVAAADGLAALELHVTVAVAAGVGHGARVDVYGGGLGGLRLLGLVAGHVGRFCASMSDNPRKS